MINYWLVAYLVVSSVGVVTFLIDEDIKDVEILSVAVGYSFMMFLLYMAGVFNLIVV